MDPSRKRTIRLTIALTVALLLASALVYTSFAAGRQELTASQLLTRAQPGQSYILAGTVLNGSVQRQGNALWFRVRDPSQHLSVPVRYTGVVPDPFAAGRGVLVTVHEAGATATATATAGTASTAFVGETNSLTTKCPSKYQAASGSY
ncbi:MAG: cytochrome c maturation protein CcmE [Actinomycetota bacterium]|nr:cytochrome c maturation protein CcmE [Actinomycetota bacterium]